MVNPYIFGSDIPGSISKPCIDEEDEVSQQTIMMTLQTMIGMFTLDNITIMEYCMCQYLF
jgi:hypothetical protein